MSGFKTKTKNIARSFEELKQMMKDKLIPDKSNEGAITIYSNPADPEGDKEQKNRDLWLPFKKESDETLNS